MNWINNIVKGLIETYHTRDIYDLIESLGIKIIRKKMSGNKKARFIRDMFNNEYIFLSNELNWIEERYVLAHELGHAVIHTDISCGYCYYSNISSDKLELQANYFAAQILIDESTFDKTDLEAMTISQLSKYFMVPEFMIKLKFKGVVRT